MPWISLVWGLSPDRTLFFCSIYEFEIFSGKKNHCRSIAICLSGRLSLHITDFSCVVSTLPCCMFFSFFFLLESFIRLTFRAYAVSDLSKGKNWLFIINSVRLWCKSSKSKT